MRIPTYVAFDAGQDDNNITEGDMKYYNLLKAWEKNVNIDFDFEDVHALKQVRDTSMEETIKRSLYSRLKESDMFVLIVGERTKNMYKFVRWEIEKAIALKLPIILINTNSKRTIDSNRMPPLLRDYPSISISFEERIVRYSMDNWVSHHNSHMLKGNMEPRQWKDSVYINLGL